jgi:MtN3 and saliva related transmembrane protein
MDTWLINSAEFLFATGLIVNAFLFIPQAWSIYRKKRSDEVSLITFGGFWLIQLFIVIHALIKHDWLLFIGYMLALITCGSVIILALMYKKKSFM